MFCMFLLAMFLASACGSGRTTTAYFFYEAVCPSCEETQRVERLAARVASWGQQEKRITVRPYDMLKSGTEAFEALERLCRDLGVDSSTVSLPVLFNNGALYQGEERIETFLSETNR